MTATLYIPRETSAISLGANEVAEAFDKVLKEKDSVKIIRNGSWGACWLEPMIEVETKKGRIAYGPVTVSDVESLLAADIFNGGDHPLCLGPTKDIPYLKNQSRITFWRVGLIDPVDVKIYEAHGGFKSLKQALSMPPSDIVNEVTASGLRGRGGAAFPTGIKWNTVLKANASQKYIVCNADEGDSGTFSDRMLMEGDPFSLIEGMAIAGLAVGADKGYIYLRSEYPLARQILEEAMAAARDAKWLGESIQGSEYSFDIEIRLGAGAYICGEETALLESLEGKRGQVRAKPPLPALEGLFGKPTVVNNVITLASVPFIVAYGAKRYGDFGEGRSLGTLPVQLAGNVKRGGLVEVPFGVSLRTLIEDFGGGTATGKPIRAVQIGGPLGAYLPQSALDTPMSYEEIAAIGGMLGHGGMVVFDDTVDMAYQARFAMEFCAIESCGKCTPCRIGSTRGVEVIDRIIAGVDRDENWTLLEDLCDTMEAGSLCAMGGLTPMPVKSAMKHFSKDFQKDEA